MPRSSTAQESPAFATYRSFESDVLSADVERSILKSLGECRSQLAEALASVRPSEQLAHAGDDPQLQAHYIAAHYVSQGQGVAGAKLGAVYRRYAELRGRLAMANMRLVAHVAKRFRDRGIAYADLLQEGFCGLLEAIDRFDVTRETKLATYATWWIRQSIQRAVAAGAYPVRLTPRHLRTLAQNQNELSHAGDESSTELLQRIHTATRPAVSLNASRDDDRNFSLLQTVCDAESEVDETFAVGETVTRLIDGLRPREREVLALRFGLGGGAKLSLSQVGKVLSISKERVRQIQERALEHLRELAATHHVDDSLISI